MSHVNYPGAIVTPSNYVPSQYYDLYAPIGHQTTGDTTVENLACQNRTGCTAVDGALIADNAAPWGTAGWIQSEMGASPGQCFTHDKTNLSLAGGKVLLLHMRFLFPGDPAGLVNSFCGNVNNVSTHSGFKIESDTSASLNTGVKITDGDGNSANGATDYEIFNLNTIWSVENSLTVFIDQGLGTVMAYLNGEAGVDFVSGPLAFPGTFNTIKNDNTDLSFGSKFITVDPVIVMQQRDIHLLILPSTVGNMGEVARQLHSTPFAPLRDSDIDL